MKVRNNYTSHLGFGTVRILPGETAPLPIGYGQNHPTVKFYIRRKWLEVIGESGDGTESAVSGVDVNVSTEGGGAQPKPLSRMNRAELQARAAELDLEFSAGDSNPALAEKIRAAEKIDEQFT